MTDRHLDVLIAGGGMVGASLALALSTLPLRVAVVEVAAPRAPGQPSYDDRATAMSLGSQRIFATLGLWPVLRTAATPIRSVHVSDRGHFGVTRLDHDRERVPALGYVVENRLLGTSLWRTLEATAVELICPARIASVRTSEDAVNVTLTVDGEDQDLRASLLVVAEGAHSRTRELLGIDVATHDYERTALIANVTPQRAHDNVAYERFTSSGPLAMLPMSNGRCSLVWTLLPADADTLLAADDATFLAALQEAFGYRLGRLRRVGARHSYPLSMRRAARVAGPRHVLIGNAANGLHPVAGQGFNLGLRDVAVLAEVLADALAAGAEDCGASSTLRHYEAWRRGDHDAVAGFTDGLARLFTQSARPLRAARSAGLLALDLATPARDAFARQSMGLAGRVPRLARGLPLQ